MKKIDIVEKKIIASIEASDQKLNPHILDAAKESMRAKKSTNVQSKIYGMAIASCAIIILCLAIVLPITLIRNNTGIREIEVVSMQSYFDENNIKVATFESFESDIQNEGETKEIKDQSYRKEKSVVVLREEVYLYMEEIYEYMNQEQITLFMIFDNNEVVKNEYFSDYLTLDSVYWVYDEYPFYYKFNEAEKEGIALTEYNGCTLYFSIRCESEKNLFQHFKNFIVLQKK